MRKHKSNFLIAILALILMIAGSVVIYTVGPRVAETQGAPSNTYILHHLPMVVAAIIAMIVMALDWQNIMLKFSRKFLGRTIAIPKNEVIWGKFALVLTAISAFLCVIIAVLGRLGSSLVDCNLGACRSLNLHGFGFQAVEMFKFCVMFYVAYLITKNKREGTFDQAPMWVPIIFILVFTGSVICVGQKDFGSTAVIVAMITAMLFIAGISWKHLFILLAAYAVLGFLMIITSEHRRARMSGFAEGSYHLSNSLIGIGTGGFSGVGLENSVQTVGYLPEALTDSIFSVICEAFGFFGAMLALVAFAVLLWQILAVAKQSENLMMRMVAVAVFAWIFAHVIINIGGMIGVIPMKGITLSFLSYGGTSLIFTGAAIGTVLYISEWTKRGKIIDEDSSSRRGERRSRNAGYSRYS